MRSQFWSHSRRSGPVRTGPPCILRRRSGRSRPRRTPYEHLESVLEVTPLRVRISYSPHCLNRQNEAPHRMPVGPPLFTQPSLPWSLFTAVVPGAPQIAFPISLTTSSRRLSGTWRHRARMRTAPATHTVLSPAALAPAMSVSGLSPTIHPPGRQRDATRRGGSLEEGTLRPPRPHGLRDGDGLEERDETGRAELGLLDGGCPICRDAQHPPRGPELGESLRHSGKHRAMPSTHCRHSASAASLSPNSARRYRKSSGYARARSRTRTSAAASSGRPRERAKSPTHASGQSGCNRGRRAQAHNEATRSQGPKKAQPSRLIANRLLEVYPRL
ncbi:hypothetical protein YW5DRAFT_06463 [Streptomyces sp. Ncost-T6T-1]|nr:hypothetical protein YW5DRAFT_06463 [Streptomyces sp. Ncost-T6T-1]